MRLTCANCRSKKEMALDSIQCSDCRAEYQLSDVFLNRLKKVTGIYMVANMLLILWLSRKYNTPSGFFDVQLPIISVSVAAYTIWAVIYCKRCSTFEPRAKGEND